MSSIAGRRAPGSVRQLRSLTTSLCLLDLICVAFGFACAWNGHDIFANASLRFLIDGEFAFLWWYVAAAILCAAWSFRTGLLVTGVIWLVGLHILLLGVFVYTCTRVSHGMGEGWILLGTPLTLAAVVLSCVVLVWSVVHRAELGAA